MSYFSASIRPGMSKALKFQGFQSFEEDEFEELPPMAVDGDSRDGGFASRKRKAEFSASNAFLRQKIPAKTSDPFSRFGQSSMGSAIGGIPGFGPRAPLVAPKGPGLVGRGGPPMQGSMSANSVPVGGRVGAMVSGSNLSMGNAGGFDVTSAMDLAMPPKVMLIIRRVSRTGDLQVADVADLKAALNQAIETGGNVEALVKVYSDSLDATTLGLIFDESIQARIMTQTQASRSGAGPKIGSIGFGGGHAEGLSNQLKSRQSGLGILSTPPETGPLGVAILAGKASGPLLAPPRSTPVEASSIGPISGPIRAVKSGKGWPVWFPPGRAYLFDPSTIIEKLNPTFLETLAKGSAELTLNHDDLRYIRDFFIQHTEYQKLNPFPILALVTFCLSQELLEKLFENNKMNALFELCRDKWELKPVEYEAVSTGELFPVSRPSTLKLFMTQAKIRYLKRTIDCEQGGVMTKSDGDIVYGKRLQTEPADYELAEIPGVEMKANGTPHLNPRVRKWIASVLYVLARKNQSHDKFVDKMKEYFGRFEIESFLSQPRIKKALEKASRNAETNPDSVEPDDEAEESEIAEKATEKKSNSLSEKARRSQLEIIQLQKSLQEIREKSLEELDEMIAESQDLASSAVGAPTSTLGSRGYPNGSDLENGGVMDPFSKKEFEKSFYDEEEGVAMSGPLYPMMGGGGPGTGRPPMMRPPGARMIRPMRFRGMGRPGMPGMVMRPRVPMAMMMRARAARGGPRPMMRPMFGARARMPRFGPRF